MKRTITAYELVLSYRDQYATLPTVGVELQELRYYADAHGYEMPDDDDVLSVCQQMRTWAQPATGQAKLWEA